MNDIPIKFLTVNSTYAFFLIARGQRVCGDHKRRGKAQGQGGFAITLLTFEAKPVFTRVKL